MKLNLIFKVQENVSISELCHLKQKFKITLELLCLFRSTWPCHLWSGGVTGAEIDSVVGIKPASSGLKWTKKCPYAFQIEFHSSISKFDFNLNGAFYGGIPSAPLVATGRAVISKASVPTAVLLCWKLPLSKVKPKSYHFPSIPGSTVPLISMKTSGTLHGHMRIGSSRGKNASISKVWVQENPRSFVKWAYYFLW